MRRSFLLLVIIVATAAGTALPQDKSPPPAPVLRLAPKPASPVGFKIRFESSANASVGGGAKDPARVSIHETTLSLEFGSPLADGVLPVVLRVARVTGTSTRMGMGSFDFDSEAAPPEDFIRRGPFFDFTALAGTEYRLVVGTDGVVRSLEGIEAAKKLAGDRAGDDDTLREAIASRITKESVTGLFSSLLGPAPFPFPPTPLTKSTTWSDKDVLEFDSWETSYEITRNVRPTIGATDSVRVAGTGSVKLGTTHNVALMPLTMMKNIQSSDTSDWTFSPTDGLPLAGSETLSMEGTLSAGKDSMSSKHRATFRVTRMDAPPPPAVRPLTGAKDADQLRQKQVDETQASQDARRRERESAGIRGAWGVSPDGALVAAGTPACDVEVWRADGVRPVAVLKGHTSLVTSVAFSRAGATLYACAEDGTVRAWEIATGKQTSLLGKPNESAQMSGSSISVGYRSVATSPDGRYAAFVRLQVGVWDTTLRAYMKQPPSILFPRDTAFLADSRRVLLAGHDEIAVFDLQAAPTSKPDVLDEGKERVELEPVWRRRKSMFGGGRELPDDLGPGLVAGTSVLEGSGLVVALVLPDGLKKGDKNVLRAWDLKTGAKRWEAATSARRLISAPKAAALLTEDETSVRFVSPENGRVLRSLPPPTKPLAPRLFAADASAWFDADRDGNLVRVPVADATGPAPGVPPGKK